MHKTVANKTGGVDEPLNEQEKEQVAIDEVAWSKLVVKEIEDAIIKQESCDKLCASAGLTQNEFDVLFSV